MPLTNVSGPNDVALHRAYPMPTGEVVTFVHHSEANHVCEHSGESQTLDDDEHAVVTRISRSA